MRIAERFQNAASNNGTHGSFEVLTDVKRMAISRLQSGLTIPMEHRAMRGGFDGV